MTDQMSNLSDQEAPALQAYVTALQERFGHQLVDVLLFGSKARGEARPDADVDVAVILDHPDAQDLSDAQGLAFDLAELPGVSLHPRYKPRALANPGCHAESVLSQSVARRRLVPASACLTTVVYPSSFVSRPLSFVRLTAAAP
jgi:predicted nucleotidyltransferase